MTYESETGAPFSTTRIIALNIPVIQIVFALDTDAQVDRRNIQAPFLTYLNWNTWDVEVQSTLLRITSVLSCGKNQDGTDELQASRAQIRTNDSV